MGAFQRDFGSLRQPAALRSWRCSIPCSQQRLADALGVTRRTVVRWEGGHRPIPPYLGWALRGLTTRLRKLERDRIGARERRRVLRTGGSHDRSSQPDSRAADYAALSEPHPEVAVHKGLPLEETPPSILSEVEKLHPMEGLAYGEMMTRVFKAVAEEAEGIFLPKQY